MTPVSRESFQNFLKQNQHLKPVEFCTATASVMQYLDSYYRVIAQSIYRSGQCRYELSTSATLGED